MTTDLGRLRELFSQACVRYREEVEATARIARAAEPDMGALLRQRQSERRAYEDYREALLAYLAAIQLELQAADGSPLPDSSSTGL